MEPEWAEAEPAPPEVRRYLDSTGRVVSWPGKRGTRTAVLAYLAARFQIGQIYSEREVNALLQRALACNDYASARRDLCDLRYLARVRDGSRYWRPEA